MILNLLVFLASGVLWIATLWLAILPRVSGWPDLAVAAAHLVPPLFVTVLYVIVRRRGQRLRASEAQAREEQAQAERKAAREAAWKKHEEDLRNRRFGCDCRMVAFTRLGIVSPGPVPDPDQLNIDIRPMLLETNDEPKEGPLLGYLTPAIDDALYTIYSGCRASFAFPMYVLPPPEIPGEEVLAYLRTAQSALAEELAPEIGWARAPILFLPSAETVPASILSLFETSPDLPGALILAFDSPHFCKPVDVDDFDNGPDPAIVVREQYSGKPGEAVVALLVTNPELPSMLASMTSQPATDSGDSMTPYWEKTAYEEGWRGSLSRVDEALRSELADLPVLGRVHRAAVRQAGNARFGVLELTRTLQDALEHAQINAGLIVPPFVHEDADVEANGEKEAAPTGPLCHAVVHNAGNVDVAGRRLAALGSAMYYFGIDLSPVDPDKALNVVTRTGDTGRASGLAQLALGVAYAAQQGGPVLCANFMPGDAVAAAFIAPAVPAQDNQST